MARITTGGTAVIAQGATVSDAIAAQERPLAWLCLPFDWPAASAVGLQGAITAEAPAAGSNDWRDITNGIAMPVTLFGLPGQIVALPEVLSLCLPFLRLKIGSAAAVSLSVPYGLRWLAA